MEPPRLLLHDLIVARYSDSIVSIWHTQMG